MPVINIPETNFPRIVIVGAGFAGITLARKLVKYDFQVVLIDKNNYHQFQPLLYQVAMAGLEPSSISFPLRKIFQGDKNMHIRIGSLLKVVPENNMIETDLGICYYDHLVIAIGAKTNFHGNKDIELNAFSLKSVSESIYLRNHIIKDYENAVVTRDYDTRQGYIDTVIVGGGPTGVEMAGALAEMKKYILPKDYHELDEKEVDIYLVHGGNQLLPGMSDKSGKAAEEYLVKMGVHVLKGRRVVGTDGENVSINDGTVIKARKVIWAAGITSNTFEGLNPECLDKSGRILVNEYHRVKSYQNIYALGDICAMASPGVSTPHAQVAQVAIQQAKNLASMLIKKKDKAFVYLDKGSMATIGRNKAVVDLPFIHFHGFFAWFVWLLVHLASILGAKNKIFILINWLWNYLTFDQSLRLILKADRKEI